MVKEKSKIIFENAIYLKIFIRFSGKKLVFNLGILLIRRQQKNYANRSEDIC